MNIIIILLFLSLVYILYHISKIKSNNSMSIIKTLVRGAARWSTASLQDKSPLIAVLHANYGAGYLWALRDAFTDTEIQRVTGINVKAFMDQIVSVQDTATKRMIQLCPNYASELNVQLATIGAEA